MSACGTNFGAHAFQVFWVQSTVRQIFFSTNLIERNTPRGGFLFVLVPDQEHGKRGPSSQNLTRVFEGVPFPPRNPEEELLDPPRRICTWCLEGGPLFPGCSSKNIVNRKETPPGGISFDQTMSGRNNFPDTDA